MGYLIGIQDPYYTKAYSNPLQTNMAMDNPHL